MIKNMNLVINQTSFEFRMKLKQMFNNDDQKISHSRNSTVKNTANCWNPINLI